MSKCVCGNDLPRGNKFCCLACYKKANGIVDLVIPEIKDNLHVGGDVL